MRTLCAMTLALALLLLPGASPAAAKAKSAPAGVVVAVSGKVAVYNAAKTGPVNMKLGQPLYAGDRIKTGANGRAQISLADGTQLKVNYQTDITLNDKDSSGKVSKRGIGSIKLMIGNLWAKVTTKDSRLEFETPAAVAAVKGTEPEFNVDELENLCVKLKEGSLDLRNDLGNISMQELQQVCIKKGFAPPQPEGWKPGQNQWHNQIGGDEKAALKIMLRDTDGQEKEVELKYKKK